MDGEWLTVTDARLIAGLTHSAWRRAYKSGPPWGKHPRTGRRGIRRADFLRWLRAEGHQVDPRHARLAVAPGKGRLFVVGQPDLRDSLMGCGPTFVPSLMALGWELARDIAWAAVIDLPLVGRLDGCQAATDINHLLKLRTLLVGVCGEDQRLTRQQAAAFDLVVQRPLVPAKVRAAVLSLRRSVIHAKGK